jgi:hypothetical protein
VRRVQPPIEDGKPDDFVIDFEIVDDTRSIQSLRRRRQSQGDSGLPSTPDEAFKAAIDRDCYSDHLTQMQMEQRLTRLPIDTGIPAMTSWDLGWNATTCLWLIQVVSRKSAGPITTRTTTTKLRIMLKRSASAKRITASRSVRTTSPCRHQQPAEQRQKRIQHAGRPRDKSRAGAAVSNVIDGVNATRRMIGQSLIDPVRCEQGQKCVRNYRKEWGNDRACCVQANLKIDTPQNHLSDSKVYAEKEFVNNDDLKELIGRHMAQFENLREDLKGMTTRLGRLLESCIPTGAHV